MGARKILHVTLFGMINLFAISADISAQVNNAGSPIVFSNGISMDSATIASQAHSGSTTPSIDNPVQILDIGGSITGDSGLEFQNGFTGDGMLGINLGSNTHLQMGYTYSQPASNQFSNGFNLQSGSLDFRYGTSTITGPLIISGNTTLSGIIIFTNNYVSGSSGNKLTIQNGTVVFTGSGSNFVLNSDISSAISANTSGTQTFTGTVEASISRSTRNGTTLLTAPTQGIYLYGGTAVLGGNNGAVSALDTSGTSVFFKGGALILDNTLANNNSRITGKVNFYGGDLTLLGVNGGATTQSITTYGFTEGLIRIRIAAGTGAGSSANLSIVGAASNMAGSSNVDFQGVDSSSKIFFTTQTPGAIGGWATVNGTEFATYNSSNGIRTMASAGRPLQVNAGTSGSYVLGSGAQNILTADRSVEGVNMTTGNAVDLGGKKLTLKGWIQNGSAGSIANGTLTGTSHYFTTNADLTSQAAVDSTYFMKSGVGTLTLTSTAKGQFFVNQGTLALNLTTPRNSIQAQATFVIGQSAANSGNATLSLLANNQFISDEASIYSFVGVDVEPAGQFKMNGYNATLSFLRMNGGSVDIGGGQLSVYGLQGYPYGDTSSINNGTLELKGFSNFNMEVANSAFQDALVINSRLISALTLNKTGSGTLVLTNSSNSYGNGTVGMSLTGGTLALANSGAAGSTSQAIQFSGGKLRADSVGVLDLPNPITGSPVSTAGSDMIFSGGYSQTTSTGGFFVSNTLRLNGFNSPNNYSSGKYGTGTLILGGTASGTSTGNFEMMSGTLGFASNTPLPNGVSIKYEGGLLQAVDASRSIANKLKIDVDLALEGSYDLAFTASSGNTLNSQGGYIYVNGTGRTTINSLVATNLQTLTKAGPGKLMLSGSATGFSSFNVAAGNLLIQGTVGSTSSTTTISSEAYLSGSGALLGPVVVNSGGTLSPGEDGGDSSLNAKSLLWNGGGILQFDLGSPSASDKLVLSGALTKGTTGTYAFHFINGTGFTAGTAYDIATFASTTFTAANFTTIGPVAGTFQIIGNVLKFTPSTPAPTVFTAASAMPTLVIAGNTANLSVLGANSGGENNLTYQWSSTGVPAPVYSVNNSNSAKNTVATFSKAGSYPFLVTITNASGLNVTSSVTVVVNQMFGFWTGENNLSGNAALPAADPNANGIPNLEEYAFGMDPQTGSLNGLPAIVYDGGNVSVSYSQLRTDVTYQPEWSTDLVNWHTDNFSISTNGTVKTASTPSGTDTRKFVRVRLIL